MRVVLMLIAIQNLKDGLDTLETLIKMEQETCQETQSMDDIHNSTKMDCHTQLQEDWINCKDRCFTLKTFSGRSGCKATNWLIYVEKCFIGADSMDCSEKYLPRMWPSGQYGLPMPNSRCPGGISWMSGYNTQFTEENTPSAPTIDNENEYTPNSFLYGLKNQVSISQGFCMKETFSGSSKWPKGRYCIYKSNSCPSGFQEGSVTWNDETRTAGNTYSGSLPDGSFEDFETEIEFCCRDDGSVKISVNLPVGQTFVLFRRGRLCQQVSGMSVLEESVKWDTDDTVGKSTSRGSIPDNEIPNGKSTVRLHYCYYH